MYNYQDERETVRELQRYLLKIQYDNSQTPTVTLDGYYDEGVRLAVKQFQLEHALPPTGTVDQNTWDLLYVTYLEILKKEHSFDLVPQGALPIGYGSRGHTVRLLQSTLLDLARFYPIPSPTLTGYYDLATVDSVRALQRAYGLYETGEVSASLWGLLVRDHESKNTTLPRASTTF